MENGIPKIIEEMQKIKDISSNFLVMWKLTGEYDRTMHQVESILNTANAIQKDTVKTTVSSFINKLERHIVNIINLNFDVEKNVAINKEISSSKISLSYLNKNIFCIEDNDTFKLLTTFISQQELIEKEFVEYLNEIKNKIKQYCDYLENNHKCDNTNFKISFSTDYQKGKIISIKRFYGKTIMSQINIKANNFIDLPIDDLIKLTSINIVNEEKLKEQENFKKSYDKLSNTIVGIKNITFQNSKEIDSFNLQLKKLLDTIGGNL